MARQVPGKNGTRSQSYRIYVPLMVLFKQRKVNNDLEIETRPASILHKGIVYLEFFCDLSTPFQK